MKPEDNNLGSIGQVTGSSRFRWWLIASAFLFSLFFIIKSPAPQIWSVEFNRADKPLIPVLTDDVLLGQGLQTKTILSYQPLSYLKLRFATYLKKAAGRIEVALLQGSAPPNSTAEIEQRQFFSTSLDAEQIADNSWVEIKIPPQVTVGDYWYANIYLLIRGSGLRPNKPITLWAAGQRPPPGLFAGRADILTLGSEAPERSLHRQAAPLFLSVQAGNAFQPGSIFSFFVLRSWVWVCLACLAALVGGWLLIIIKDWLISCSKTELVAVCFFVTAVFMFIIPTFFNETGRIQFPAYIPVSKQVGVDLRKMLTFCENWIRHGQPPYVDAHPPFGTIFFAPLVFVSALNSFLIITLANLVSHVFTTLTIPKLVLAQKRGFQVAVIIFATSFLSYGLLFSIDNGQFDIFLFALALAAIYLFHHTRHNLPAYALFTIAVQLKLYPAIFAIMLIRDWSEWWPNLKRLAGLAVVNFAALFVLGVPTFWTWVTNLLRYTENAYCWEGSSSIKSYLTLNLPTTANVDLIRMLVLSVYLLGLGLIILTAYKRRLTGFNPGLLLYCTLGALIIPDLSNDYKLPILAGPVALYLGSLPFEAGCSGLALIRRFLTALMSCAFFTTIFSYTTRPKIIDNVFPVLAFLSIAVVISELINLFTRKPNTKPVNVW